MYKLHQNILEFYRLNPEIFRKRLGLLIDIAKDNDENCDCERLEKLALKAYNFDMLIDENDIAQFLNTGTIKL